MIGGDFNLHPTEISNYAAWSSNFEENDEFAPYIATIGSSKFDYVWARDEGTGKLGISVTSVGGSFDHRYLVSAFAKTL